VITSPVICTLREVEFELGQVLISNFVIQDESAARAKEDDERRKEVAAKFQVQSNIHCDS